MAGWYSDPAKDILRRYGPSDLKWSVAAKTDAVPNQTLCHGTIYNVRWKGRAELYDLAVPDADNKNFQFAVGNTTTEALAALLANRLDKPGVEALLEAFSEDQLAQHGDLAGLESALHSQRFGSVVGGQEFAIG